MTQDNRNGHEPEQAPQVTGFRPGPAVPSIHDLAMMGEIGGYGAGWNLAKELITGSKEPEEYLPRGVHTHKKIARRKRLVSKDYRIRGRRGSNLKAAIWVGDQMEIGLNGAGREDAKEVARAVAQVEAQSARRGFFDRVNRPNPQGQNGN